MAAWTRVDDGEYNEQTAMLGRQREYVVTLHSDRDGETWHWRANDGDSMQCEATSEAAARLEVEREVLSWR